MKFSTMQRNKFLSNSMVVDYFIADSGLLNDEATLQSIRINTLGHTLKGTLNVQQTTIGALSGLDGCALSQASKRVNRDVSVKD